MKKTQIQIQLYALNIIDNSGNIYDAVITAYPL